MDRIKLVVPIVPTAQPRQRQSIIGKGTENARVHNYTPSAAPVHDFKKAIRKAAADIWQGPPMVGPIGVVLTFLFPRPKRLIWRRRPMFRMWYDIKPDIDNLEKSTYDTLSGLVYVDDKQICHHTVAKHICASGEEPQVQIEVYSLAAMGAIRPERCHAEKMQEFGV